MLSETNLASKTVEFLHRPSEGGSEVNKRQRPAPKPARAAARQEQQRASTHMALAENQNILTKCNSMGYGWAKIKSLHYSYHA